MTEEEMRERVRKKYAFHFKHADGLLGLAQDVLYSFKGQGKGSYERAVWLATGRAFKAYHSVLKLCEIAHTEDAAVVLRSLFNLLVIVRWLRAGEGTARADKYLAWFWVALHEQLECPHARFDAKLRGLVTKRYEENKHLFEYRDKNGQMKIRDKWHQPEANDISAMAKQVELEEHYQGLYKTLSSVEHSDAFGYFGMISSAESTGGTIELNLHSDLFVPVYVRNAFQYFADIFSLWNKAFQAVDQKKLDGEIESARMAFAEHGQLPQENL